MAEYESLRAAHVPRYFELLIEFAQRADWPRPRIDEEQTRRLRETIVVAREKSAWHRARLAHVDVERLTRDDLPSLPAMTKDDLMTHWNEIVTDPRLSLALANRHLESATSDAYLLDRYHVI